MTQIEIETEIEIERAYAKSRHERTLMPRSLIFPECHNANCKYLRSVNKFHGKSLVLKFVFGRNLSIC